MAAARNLLYNQAPNLGFYNCRKYNAPRAQTANRGLHCNSKVGALHLNSNLRRRGVVVNAAACTTLLGNSTWGTLDFAILP